jgi:hypothetical protein
MRNRQLSPTGDYTFGSGQLNYLINTPAAVAQAVQTTLLLWLGEWYLNVNAGTPYPEAIIGTHSQAIADNAIINVINNVQGMINISNYQSQIDPVTRKYSVISGTLNTIYGETEVQFQDSQDF